VAEKASKYQVFVKNEVKIIGEDPEMVLRLM
jgi:hypothetical protein